MFYYQEANSTIPYNYDARTYSETSIPAHLHSDYEFIWIQDGYAEVTIEGNKLRCESGQMLLLLSDQIHSILIARESRVWICVFSPDYVPEFARRIKDQRCSQNSLTLPQEEELLLGRKLIAQNPDKLEKCACLMLICSAFMKSRTSEEFHQMTHSKGETLLHQILFYVTEHYRENITLKEMAVALGYEEHYLSRVFARCFHMNFKQLVNAYRVRYAKQLMLRKDSSLSMTEIAYLSGFQSVRNFNRAYRTFTGCSPREEPH